MQMSYNCKLKELEAKRVDQLTQKKIEFDVLVNRRKPLSSLHQKELKTAKQAITSLLNKDEILDFLLQASQFLYKHQQLWRDNVGFRCGVTIFNFPLSIFDLEDRHGSHQRLKSYNRG